MGETISGDPDARHHDLIGALRGTLESSEGAAGRADELSFYNSPGSSDFRRHQRSPFTPRLAYGRHRGPARTHSRRAAVVIAIYPHPTGGQYCFVLTRRPLTLSHHGGQVCLPGGRIEAGESAYDAALREFHEELGVKLAAPTLLGYLSPIYVFASDNLVQTLVVSAQLQSTPWKPDPTEVDEVIEMPIERLRCSSVRDYTRPRHRRPVGHSAITGEEFDYQFGFRAIELPDRQGVVRQIWGATAILLGEFSQRIDGILAVE